MLWNFVESSSFDQHKARIFAKIQNEQCRILCLILTTKELQGNLKSFAIILEREFLI